MKIFSLLIILIIATGASHFVDAQAKRDSSPIQFLLPDKVYGYKKHGKQVARKLKIGNIQYDLCEKYFIKDKTEVKLLLFDYADAPIMYTQVMRDREKMIAVDSVYFSNYSLLEGKAYQSFNPNQKSAQFFAGINERFFLQISCENCSLDFLLPVIQSVRFSEFPK